MPAIALVIREIAFEVLNNLKKQKSFTMGKPMTAY